MAESVGLRQEGGCNTASRLRLKGVGKSTTKRSRQDVDPGLRQGDGVKTETKSTSSLRLKGVDKTMTARHRQVCD
jgi:hypothetical protein